MQIALQQTAKVDPSRRLMKKIKKDRIIELLDFLIQKYQVIAPASKDDGVVDFDQIREGSQAKLEFSNSNEPPKKLFFPQSETLFSYTKDNPAAVPELKPKKHRIIFGIRPCDTRSLKLLGNVFDAPDYKDPYYIERRKNTTLFTLACNDPKSNCFCGLVGIGPFFKDDTDVFVVDTGDEYLFEPITPAGESIVNEIPGLEDAVEEDMARMQKLESKADSKVAKKFKLDDLPEKLAELSDHPIWDEIHEKCVGCGVCTYFCPTCHCFDIVDEQEDDKGRRVRVWDSCMYPAFTLEASRHNPRQTGKERMRQRLMHKFRYFVENSGEFGCVGCGRCSKNCPVGSDIIKVLEKLDKLK